MHEQNQQLPPSISPKVDSIVIRKSSLVYLVVFLLAFAGGSFAYGDYLGRKGYIFQPKDFKIINQSDAPKVVDYGLLWNAIDAVNKNYIDRPVSHEKFLYGAVRGAVAATGDAYTSFFDPQALEDFKQDFKGSFDGIGAEVGKKDGNIVIVAPLEGTPAKRAGLKAKDIIVKVNGESTAEWSVDQAVHKIRGPKGTEVTLNIYRDGIAKPFDVKIVRDKIENKIVKVTYANISQGEENKQVAIILLPQFGDGTKAEFDKAVDEVLRQKNLAGVILDLRDNGGGYLDTATDIASNWIPIGKVVVTEERSDKTKSEVYNSYGYGRLANLKTVILVNGGTASASEIVAGALHDYKLATLVGEKTFGKGSVQELFELPGKTAVKVTVAKWLTPSGRNLNKDGIEPDVAVKPTDGTKGEDDPQKQKALEQFK